MADKINYKVKESLRHAVRILKHRIGPYGLDETKTIARAMAAAKRAPTYLLEPNFCDIFPETEDLILEKYAIDNPIEYANSLKDTTIEDFLLKKFVYQLNEYRSKKILNKIDELLKLEGIKFDVSTFDDAFNCLPKSTSSAFPNYTTPKSAEYQTIKAWFERLKGNFYDCKQLYVTIGWRTQMRKSGIKFRQIYMLPQLIQVIEGMFFKPFLDHFLKLKGKTAYSIGCTWKENRKIYLSHVKSAFSICTDFASFDMSMPNFLISMFYVWMKRHLKIHNQFQDYLFNLVKNYMLSCHIITSHKNKACIILKERGIMSGSVFTNFCGTFCNMFITLYSLDFARVNINSVEYHFLGDDSVLIFKDQTLNKEEVLDALSANAKYFFDTTISKEKTLMYTKDAKHIYYLGFEFNDTEKVFDVELAKRKLILTERFIPESVLTTEERLISKLASICFICTDGWKYFDIWSAKLCKLMNIRNLPTYYVNLIESDIHAINYQERLSISDNKYTGWMNC